MLLVLPTSSVRDMYTVESRFRPGDGDIDVWNKATLSQQSLPHLDADDAEDGKDEEAQHQNVAEHRERVE